MMEGCGWKMYDSKEPVERIPDGAYEFCFSVRSNNCWNQRLGSMQQSRTLAHSSAVVDWRGICPGHLYSLSMMVKRKIYPLDFGRGPTKSM